ncbi:MAG: class I SAM-dependent methyltransferase [Spirochaetes bacterium]|nr:class I SAM-dependent methyltransferase [Spirochaetota bacterium]
MSRLNEIVSFINYDFSNRVVIEPEKRSEKLRESLFDVISTYNPGVIVKAGLGSGHLLYELAKGSDAYIIAVEPSMNVIREFLKRHAGDPIMSRIHLINGEFNEFPIDYYAADLLICIDNLNFLESGKVVDEFRRALQFDGVLFMAGVVLFDDDIEGLYDDFMKAAFPLHNDYYLRDDLKTVLTLNEFKFVKGSIDYYPIDLFLLANYLNAYFQSGTDAPLGIIDDNLDEFVKLYDLEKSLISEPYYISIYLREKPKTNQ